jgi:hypothetical protein
LQQSKTRDTPRSAVSGAGVHPSQPSPGLRRQCGGGSVRHTKSANCGHVSLGRFKVIERDHDRCTAASSILRVSKQWYMQPVININSASAEEQFSFASSRGRVGDFSLINFD